MKILSFTAGAAGMYCGSCLRDNALAAELLRRGHDVMLVPLYTPTRTDERNVSSQQVFFGGISVYLEQRFALFRRTPWLLDRLWDSRWALRAASRRSIKVDAASLGDLTVSVLKGEHGFQRKELDKLLHWLRGEPPPDVIVLPNSLLIGLAGPIRRALGRPLLCTLQGEDLFLDGLQAGHRKEAMELIRASVAHVDAFLATSEYYARFMSEYLGIPRDRMHVVRLGISLEDFPVGSRPASAKDERVFKIGYLARVAPEKGLHMLAEAYRVLRERHIPEATVRLDVAGYLASEHEAYLTAIEHQMQSWGFAGEFRYHGALDRNGKLKFLQRLDAFSMPASYAEPKGMSVLEALAAGVPVVQPRRGAFTEILERTGGGLLVDPDDPEALAEGLATIHAHPERAREMRQQGVEGVRAHYSVARMADRALEVFAQVARASAASPRGGEHATEPNAAAPRG